MSKKGQSKYLHIVEEAVSLYRQGWSCNELAAKYGMNKRMIMYVLKVYGGITLRTSKEGQRVAAGRGRSGAAKKGERHHLWKGGTSTNPAGYVYVKMDDGSYRGAHVVAAERALGRRLPERALVHHVDEKPGNNVNSNLVICESPAYHRLLHQRAESLRATGSPLFRRCMYCHLWDLPPDIYISRQRGFHKPCRTKYYNDNKHRWGR